MGAMVSHYLVDWESFCDTWHAEENPRDALEGALHQGGLHDPYFSGLMCFHDHCRRLAESAEPEDGGGFEAMPWWPAIEELMPMLTGALDGQGPRDLDDDYAYRDGGFAQTMNPERVARVAALFREIEIDACRPWVVECGLEKEFDSFKRYFDERDAIFRRGAELGKGYVSTVG